MARAGGRAIHGWIVLDKPSGISSAGALARVKHLLGAAKAGHAGTLDPLASGVLPIALGEATKTVAFVMGGEKRYRFTVRWGEARDSGDAEGRLIGESPVRPSAAAIAAALPAFHGRIRQVPPIFSAIKVKGERAYARARRAEPVALEPRSVDIAVLALLQARPEEADFELVCGTGTYVRSLAVDLAAALGTLGHVGALRRLKSGPFDEKTAISLDKCALLGHSPAPEAGLLPVEAALVDIPALCLTEGEAVRLRRGQPVRVDRGDEPTVCALTAGRPVAVAKIAGGEARAVRVFNL